MSCHVITYGFTYLSEYYLGIRKAQSGTRVLKYLTEIALLVAVIKTCQMRLYFSSYLNVSEAVQFTYKQLPDHNARLSFAWIRCYQIVHFQLCSACIIGKMEDSGSLSITVCLRNLDRLSCWYEAKHLPLYSSVVSSAVGVGNAYLRLRSPYIQFSSTLYALHWTLTSLTRDLFGDEHPFTHSRYPGVSGPIRRPLKIVSRSHLVVGL